MPQKLEKGRERISAGSEVQKWENGCSAGHFRHFQFPCTWPGEPEKAAFRNTRSLKPAGKGCRGIIATWYSATLPYFASRIVSKSASKLHGSRYPLTRSSHSPYLHMKDEDQPMKRRILLVDDELAILLTLKAVLEISGFEVETAASAREAKLKIRSNQYHMVITDMRMESDFAGTEVVQAARKAAYQPAVAMLTAFPMADTGSDSPNPDKMLVKPMNANDLLRQLEALLVTHEDNKRRRGEKSLPFAAEALPPPVPAVRAAARKKTPTKKLASAH